MEFTARLQKYSAEGIISRKIEKILEEFYLSYRNAVANNGHPVEKYLPTLHLFLDLVIKDLQHPYTFEPYHEKLMKPVDYYHFGLDMIRPLIMFETSKVAHPERFTKMDKEVSEGHNVILLANHQTEPDPQAISLLLEQTHPQFAQDIIFVAGHRVITDPLAVPFSLGRNLICIYSKKHIENPPELKMEKLRHNHKTMKRLSQLLAEGGKCIYVAPSGGRDRPNASGVVDVAPFDPQSIEMFWLLSKQSGTPTHFYPLALKTYDLLPPPNSVEKELGENRQAQCTSIAMAAGAEIDMDAFSNNESLSKKEARQVRAQYIWEQVCNEYNLLIQ